MRQNEASFHRILTEKFSKNNFLKKFVKTQQFCIFQLSSHFLLTRKMSIYFAILLMSCSLLFPVEQLLLQFEIKFLRSEIINLELK